MPKELHVSSLGFWYEVHENKQAYALVKSGKGFAKLTLSNVKYVAVRYEPYENKSKTYWGVSENKREELRAKRNGTEPGMTQHCPFLKTTVEDGKYKDGRMRAVRVPCKCANRKQAVSEDNPNLCGYYRNRTGGRE